MPDQPRAKHLSRSTVYAPLRAGEAFGKPLSEIAYITPRFPSGIKGSDLAMASEAIQRETMAFWYLANFTPATGTYFGFSEVEQMPAPGVLDASPSKTIPSNPGLKVAGFGQGRWFSGGRSPELLRAEFEDHVSARAIAAVAEVFSGLWEWMPYPPVAFSTSEDVKAAIAAALDAFESRLKEIGAEYGGFGHNGPSEDEPITLDDKLTALKAVSDMRLAISSGADNSALETIWSGASGITVKLGGWVLSQVNIFIDNFTPAAGKALGEKSPYLLFLAVLYFQGSHITDLLKILATFR